MPRRGDAATDLNDAGDALHHRPIAARGRAAAGTGVITSSQHRLTTAGRQHHALPERVAGAVGFASGRARARRQSFDDREQLARAIEKLGAVAGRRAGRLGGGLGRNTGLHRRRRRPRSWSATAIGEEEDREPVDRCSSSRSSVGSAEGGEDGERRQSRASARGPSRPSGQARAEAHADGAQPGNDDVAGLSQAGTPAPEGPEGERPGQPRRTRRADARSPRRGPAIRSARGARPMHRAPCADERRGEQHRSAPIQTMLLPRDFRFVGRNSAPALR